MKLGQNAVFNRATEYSCTTKATIGGVAKKTVVMLIMALISTLVCINFVEPLNDFSGGVILFGYLISPILTFVLSMIMSFSPNAAKTLAIPYSILEGVSIGCVAGILTGVLNETGGLIVGLAFIVTLSFFLGAAMLYCTGIVKVGTGLRRFAFTALSGLLISSLIIGIVGIFNRNVYAFFYGSTDIALIFAIISVFIASIYSLISLDNAKRFVDSGLDRSYEWYAAFGIVLNIIWLFWEVLRLVLILFSKSDN